jgi:hypothetical protein
LSGGYIPFTKDSEMALENGDPRNSIDQLYRSFDDYLQEYETATDRLIDEGYLLVGFKQAYMGIAHGMKNVFD